MKANNVPPPSRRFRCLFGDTLVEVALAIGIFSMVAIAVVSVVSGSSSSTQAALETTITREEIDSQAEALRFIHASYNAGGEVGGSEANRYKSIWKEITEDAIDLTDSGYGESIKNIIMNYSPSNCAELYDTGGGDELSVVKQHAFIINTRALSNGSASDVIIRPSNGSGSKLRSAATYPRLIYEDDSDTLLGGESNKLQYAEGIYIVAVKDPDSTVVISDDGKGGSVQKISAYYDFYIHTCWFNPNEERPSTMSTVVRLYDPDTISSNEYSRSVVTIKYDGNGATSGSMAPQYVISGKTTSLLPNKYERTGFKFMGWDADGNGTIDYAVNDDGTYDKKYTAPANMTSNQTITFKAVWAYTYTLTYYNAAGTTPIGDTITAYDLSTKHEFTISRSDPLTFDGTFTAGNKMEFIGWSENKDGSGKIYKKDGANGALTKITAEAPDHQNIKLYQIWREVITFTNIGWTSFGRANISSSNTGIYLGGYGCTSANGGTYFAVGKDDAFELTAKLTTNGIVTHPNGAVGIIIGPLLANITKSGGNLVIDYGYMRIGSSYGSSYTFIKSKTITSSGTVTIKMTKYGNTYTMAVNNDGTEVKIVETSGGKYNVVGPNGNNLATNLPSTDLDNIKVTYGMWHGSHCCSSIFNATLSDIRMTTASIYYSTD